ncbi:4-(cytidine 5'-diphospho)-2-C-methyl-D-erythritol kinase [Candidatus Woesearchaeota archaeon]|nr:4-(cytidine 5'-diphospho)-2-C-methyl-D-erythritol kinase [Candidatus Woesearchaeota archaeon]
MKSYAKINLTLDILGKRDDGFHDVETVYQQVDLYDTIEIQEENGVKIKCNLEFLENEHNLAYQAAELLRKKYAVANGALITLTKRIPIGGGLSGGSSNAATVLRGLNALWDLHLSEDELIEIAKELGSDVAFHILGGTCLGKGKGERLEKIKDFPSYHVVIVYPGFHISTKKSYSQLDYDQTGKIRATKRFMESYDPQYLHNDFEYSVFKGYPELGQLKKELGRNSLLCGSGSCMFGLFKEEKEAEEVAERLKHKYKDVFLCKT